MTILVTGATGFLGKRVCKDLLDKGYKVRALGRNQKLAQELIEYGCEFMSGDVRDAAQMLNACQNTAGIIHCAALSSPWGDREDFYAINIQGTQNLLQAAIKNQVKRFIYVSSTSVYFNFQNRFNIKESDSIANPAPSLYTESKIAAEKVIKQFQDKEDLETVIIRPRGIFGPGDTTLIPRLVKAFDKGKLPIIGSEQTLIDITYVGNVSHALILALEADSSCTGEIYNISNDEPIKLWQTVEYILDRCQRKFKRKKVPFPLVYFLAWLSEVACRYFFTSKEPTLTRYTAGLMAKSQTINIDKAKNKLGYQPIKNIKDSIEEMLDWYLKTEQHD